MTEISHALAWDLRTYNRIILMGQSEDVAVATTVLGERARVVPAVPVPAQSPRVRVRSVILKACKAAAPDSANLSDSFDKAATLWGIDPRARVRDVKPRLLPVLAGITLAIVAEPTHVVFAYPFDTATGSARTALRNRLTDVCERLGVGLIVSTRSVTDAFALDGWTVVLEKGQVADQGPLAGQLATPRSNLAAAHARVNVFSGLARRGWLSIGHSQVKAKTDLDGKVFVTIPHDATTLSFDEFDPVFMSDTDTSDTGMSDTVFEALITQVRDSGDRVQLVLSPADTEVGLALTTDLWDVGAGRSGARPAEGGPDLGRGILHPALGDTVAQQARRVRAGARVFVQVDTARMRAYPVDDAAPTAVQ